MAKLGGHANASRFTSRLLFCSQLFTLAVGIKPKFIANPVSPGKSLGHSPEAPFSTLSSKFAAFTGSCSPEAPFEFPLSAGSGRGVVVLQSQDHSIELQFSAGSNLLDGSTIERFESQYQSSLFGFEAETAAFSVVPFGFRSIDIDGANVLLNCPRLEEKVLVLFKDDSGMKVEADSVFETNTAHTSVDTISDAQRIELANGMRSENVLRGETPRSPVEEIHYLNQTRTGITVKPIRPGKTGNAIIQLSIRHDSGKLLRRTLITEVRSKSMPPAKIIVKEFDIDDNGDVAVAFVGVGNPGSALKFDARMGLRMHHTGMRSIIINIVDVSAILLVEEAKLVFHRAWIGRLLEQQGLLGTETDGTWDIVVTEAVATNPEDSYQVVGSLDMTVSMGLDRSPFQKTQARLLAVKPTDEERHISAEMRRGRAPKGTRNRSRNHRAHGSQGNLRGLESGVHKKILVHGYCSSTNPFPTSHFSNYISFSDPDTSNPLPSSWSNDAFARKISKFADNNGLHGCACIAHSQGGAACLHLNNYYWSCLDTSSNVDGGTVSGRSIQSVGTPYLGTALAGDGAALADIFGIGCGSSPDMTYTGSNNWLDGISSSAKSQVYYYTTSFEDVWWRYDYCNIVTDLLLDDPDDGVTERAYGQLSGGNNAGHKEGWCHSSTLMRDPGQAKDESRNIEMNNMAWY